MSFMQPLGVSDGDGLYLQNQDTTMLSHAAISIGDVLSVDTSVVSNGRFTTVKTPAAADITSLGAITKGIFCVALTSASAAGQKIRVRFAGTVDASISGTPASGAYVIPTTGKQLAITAAAANNGNTVVGMMIDTGVNNAVKKVMFNGFGMAQNLTNTT